jgi:protein-S-isoprenylcysteine O-methyltransferase Ste14
MSTSSRPHALMYIPPPLLFVLTFLAGVGLQRLLPISISSSGFLRIAHNAGIGLIATGVLLALTSVAIFLLMARTTLIPHGSASKLVNWGPYRFTRNPMYISLVTVYLGVAGALGQAWPLLLLALPVIFIHRVTIPFEEARMRSLFGDEFDQYCSQTRRWI